MELLMQFKKFKTTMYNHCSSFNNLLRSKDGVSNDIRKMFVDYFGINTCSRYKKYGMCVDFFITYNESTDKIIKIRVNSVKLYLCNYKIQLKYRNNVEILLDYLNNPIIHITNENDYNNIIEFLFYKTTVDDFILDQIRFERYKNNGVKK